MTQAAKSHEPSMEEILASIRRIIADEESAKPGAVTEAAAGRSTSGPGLPGSSEAAAFGAADEHVEQDEIETEAAAPLAQEGSEPEAKLGTPRLGEAMPEPEAAADGFSDIDVHANENFEEAEAAPAKASRIGGHLRALDTPAPMLSAEATAAVNSAFGTLAHTVLVQNARTLEDLVKEMLRPMLKMWLDDNLPNLVERLVRAEIERVSRGQPG
jgi:cell pole-organizing protein PopZ